MSRVLRHLGIIPGPEVFNIAYRLQSQIHTLALPRSPSPSDGPEARELKSASGGRINSAFVGSIRPAAVSRSSEIRMRHLEIWPPWIEMKTRPG